MDADTARYHKTAAVIASMSPPKSCVSLVHKGAGLGIAYPNLKICDPYPWPARGQRATDGRERGVRENERVEKASKSVLSTMR